VQDRGTSLTCRLERAAGRSIVGKRRRSRSIFIGRGAPFTILRQSTPAHPEAR
jgi:hypothetical protein